MVVWVTLLPHFFLMVGGDRIFYQKHADNSEIAAATTLRTIQTTSKIRCAGHCSRVPSCAVFSFNGESCRLAQTADELQTSGDAGGGSVYVAVAIQQVGAGTQVLATTTTEPSTTTGLATTQPVSSPDILPAPTTPSSDDCVSPVVTNTNYNPSECNGKTYFDVTAAVRLHSSRGLLFRADGKYLKCTGLNQWVSQSATQCQGPYSVTGDSGLDPGQNRFPGGIVDAGVAYLPSNGSDARYFLMTGNTVYCYMPDDGAISYMKPCTTWISKTIQERFGSGIPDTVDYIIGNVAYSWEFYFVKDETVYKSDGNADAGTLQTGYPTTLNEWNPHIPCDVTGADIGLNDGEIYTFSEGDSHIAGISELTYTGPVCHT